MPEKETMKKSFWVISIVVLVLMLVFFYFARTRCGYDASLGGYQFTLIKASGDVCDKSCVNDDDCQPFVGSCININEKPYFPERLSVAYYAVNCSCENRVCAGKPTGEMMI